MEQDRRFNMAASSVWIGVVAILFSTTGILGLMFGGIAVMMGVLSRPVKGPMFAPARTGIILGSIAIAAAYLMVIMSFMMLLRNPEISGLFRNYLLDGSAQNLQELLEALQSY
ncbi:hypothetical protein [Butyrivibrio sp. MC2013]|uniref:hypothetical protein n=1 Tax=Butyrivibrio sp. MC2013 TaxID=1280686 RepID=UPI0003FCF860|nr:hypothetical protein [Butyrivibrio sp. MC2013]